MKLVVFDATDVGARWKNSGGGADGTSRVAIGLTPIWRAGTLLYEARGHADAILAATSWSEALRWAAGMSQQHGRSISSLQVWGHGGFGNMRLQSGTLDEAALGSDQALARDIDAVRDALDAGALVWLRCCSAFGHTTGQRFGRALADRLRVRVAGHTHIIGFFQSGTHALRPNETPAWSMSEGVRFDGSKAVGARGSSPLAPNTTTCLNAELPSWA